MQDASFYVYYYLRASDSVRAKKGTPYYVGKGKGKRITTRRNRIGVPPDPANRIKIAEGLTEEQAHMIEKVHIKLWGRLDIGTGILYNLSDGGEGSSGHIWYPEQRERQRLISKEIFSRPSVQEKHKNSMRRARQRPEYKAKMHELNNDPVFKDMHRQACIEAHNRPEVIAKKSKSMKQTASTDEYKARRQFVNSLPETRANRSKAMKKVASRPGHLEKRLASLFETNGKPEVKAKRSKSAKECNNRPEKIEHQKLVAKDINKLRRLSVPEHLREKQWHKDGVCVYSIDSPGEGWTRGRPPKQKIPCPFCGKLLGHSPMHRKFCSSIAGMNDAEL